MSNNMSYVVHFATLMGLKGSYMNLTARTLLGLGGVALFIGVTATCSGGYPTSPSATSGGYPTSPSATSGGSSRSPGSSGVNSSQIVSGVEVGGREDGSGGRDGRAQRRRQYCERIQPGHEHYERCQAWLNSGRGDGARGRDGGAQRRRQYCERIQPGHERYERCQAWLNSERRGRGQRDR